MSRRRRIALNPTSRQCKAIVSKWHRSRRANSKRKSGGGAGGSRGPRRRFEPFADVLASIGFDSYADYLQSLLWATVRRRAFDRWGDRCRACKGQATQMHHADYSRGTLKGDTLDHLWPVCNACHREAHEKAGTIEQATAWLRGRWREGRG